MAVLVVMRNFLECSGRSPTRTGRRTWIIGGRAAGCSCPSDPASARRRRRPGRTFKVRNRQRGGRRRNKCGAGRVDWPCRNATARLQRTSDPEASSKAAKDLGSRSVLPSTHCHPELLSPILIVLPLSILLLIPRPPGMRAPLDSRRDDAHCARSWSGAEAPRPLSARGARSEARLSASARLCHCQCQPWSNAVHPVLHRRLPPWP